MRPLYGLCLVLSVLGGIACGDDSEPPPPPPLKWEIIHEDLQGALLSTWGSSASDVWVVGADARDGKGPLVLHYDGSSWERLETGETQGNLWWVHGFAAGPIFMGGDGGVILRYESGSFTKMQTPGTASVFGIWGASPTEIWAVGGESAASGGFVWKSDGSSAWTDEPTLPANLVSGAAVWKAFGTSASDVWFVGSGVSLYWDGQSLTEGNTGVGSSLFTVHAAGGRYAAVGGLASGIIVENAGDGWKDVTPSSAPVGLSGVCLTESDLGYAVGQYGSVYVRGADGWAEEQTELGIGQNLHNVWVDPDGGVWAAGGQTAALPLTQGVLIYKGQKSVAKGL